jgi:hypothetical protein
MPRTVAIVYDPDFSAPLENLSFHTPVWLVDTPANHEAAEERWLAAVEWPHISVTLFREDDDLATLLQQIGLRERAVDSVEAIGSILTAAAREALAGAGFPRVDETENGFRARRG